MEDTWPQMRRKDRKLNEEDTLRVLEKGEYGVLATVDRKGQPYAVPLSYIYYNGELYFHCALSGQKLDNLAANPRASFNVVMNTQPVYENGSYSTFYDSATVFGSVSEVSEPEKKRAVLLALTEKYFPEHMDPADETITKMMKVTAVYGLEILKASGKAKKKPVPPEK